MYHLFFQYLFEFPNELLALNGVIILEYDKTKNIDIQSILDELNINVNIVKSKKYGRCLLAILRKN